MQIIWYSKKIINNIKISFVGIDPLQIDTHKSPRKTKIHVIDSKSCIFCNLEIETIEHLFVDCPDLKEIWCAVENIHIANDKTDILFGKFYICNMHKVENLAILVEKYLLLRNAEYVQYEKKQKETNAILDITCILL